MIGNLFDSPWKILLVAVVLIVLFAHGGILGGLASLRARFAKRAPS